MAQGHEITRTVIAVERAIWKSPVAIIHVINTAEAMAITIGTNTPATLSASLAIGAFDALASSTTLIIWLIVESSPTLSAFI